MAEDVAVALLEEVHGEVVLGLGDFFALGAEESAAHVEGLAVDGVGAGGETLNVNADTAAGAIAAAVNARRLLMLTDVAGVIGTASFATHAALGWLF